MTSPTKLKEVFEDLIYMNGNGFQALTHDRIRINIATSNAINALGALPFTLKTLNKHHMVRESGWISGRSKLKNPEDREAKTTAELVDGLRNYCNKCAEWMPWLGLDASPGQNCNFCGGGCELKTRYIAVSDRYQSTIRLPWVMSGKLDFSKSKCELRTMKGDPFTAVLNAMNSFDWTNVKVWRTNTNQRHEGHGIDARGLKGGRIYGLVCRIPVLDELGNLVPMWANVPCDKYGDISAGQRFHGLIDTNIKRIINFNNALMQRSKLISLLTEKRIKVTPELVNANPCVESFLKSHPRSKTIDPVIVARVYDLKVERRSKVIET